MLYYKIVDEISYIDIYLNIIENLNNALVLAKAKRREENALAGTELQKAKATLLAALKDKDRGKIGAKRLCGGVIKKVLIFMSALLMMKKF